MATRASPKRPTKSSITKSAAAAARDEALRLKILDSALGQIGVPDPASAITIDRVAERLGAASSSIAYQFGPDAGREAIEKFRRLAFARAIERFEASVGDAAHGAVLEAARQGASPADIIATLMDRMVDQLVADPATRLLLSVSVRSETNPVAAEVAESAWSRLSGQIVDIIQLVLASKQLDLDIERQPLAELIQLALTAGWLEKKVLDTSAMLTVHGLRCSTATALLWSSIASHIVGHER